MTYGLKILNGSDELIIDSNYPPLMQSSTGTSTASIYTLYTATSPKGWFGSSARVYYHGPVPVGTVRFWELASGDAIAPIGNGYWLSAKTGTQTTTHSIPYVDVAFPDLISYTSSGYGLEVRSSDGTLIYTSDLPLLTVTGIARTRLNGFNADGGEEGFYDYVNFPSPPVNDRAFAIDFDIGAPTPYPTHVAVTSTGFGWCSNAGTGVFRMSSGVRNRSGTFESYPFIVDYLSGGYSGNRFAPEPVEVLFANM